MNKTIVPGLIALQALLLAITPGIAQTQPNQEARDCSATLLNARDLIEQGRDVEVVDIRRTNIASYYPDHPEGRPLRYIFRMGGSAAEDVMASPQMLTSLSKEIIDRCQTVSEVSFNLDQTDYVRSFGLMGLGKIEEFRCVIPGPDAGRPLAWGYHVCL